MFDEALLGRRPVSAFASAFQDFFNQELAAFPVGTWVEEVYILDFLKQRLSTAATKAVLGPRIIDANPNFMEVFWRYERFVEPLAFGLLTSLNRQGRQARDQFRDMCYRWYRLAIQEFKSDDIISCNNLDWEPAFGSLVSRKLAWWVKSFDFSAQSQGAAFSLFLFGLHANTIPISAWIIMELIRDPELFRAVREEVAQANEGTNNESLNHEKVASLPLLQSIYTEVLRLHVRVLITRTSHEPVTIAGYNLPKGSIVQAPTEVGHLDEAVWDTPGHPASEFWGYRHVRETETIGDEGRVLKRLQFSLEGKAGSFFPFAIQDRARNSWKFINTSWQITMRSRVEPLISGLLVGVARNIQVPVIVPTDGGYIHSTPQSCWQPQRATFIAYLLSLLRSFQVVRAITPLVRGTS